MSGIYAENFPFLKKKIKNSDLIKQPSSMWQHVSPIFTTDDKLSDTHKSWCAQSHLRAGHRVFIKLG